MAQGFVFKRFLAELSQARTATMLFGTTRDYFAVLSWLTATAFLTTVASAAIQCRFFMAPLAILPVLVGYALILTASLSTCLSEFRRDRSSRKYLSFVLPLMITIAIAALWLFTAYGWAMGGVISENICVARVNKI